MSGVVSRVAGPVVFATGLEQVRLYDVVRIGELELAGEVIGLREAIAVIQVYEDTTGVAVGDLVLSTGAPLQVELGPGLLGGVFDGVQRPLAALAASGGNPFGQPYLERGAMPPALDRTRSWEFSPRVEVGQEVGPGDVLGEVVEGRLTHKILVPPGLAGTVRAVRPGPARVDDEVVRVDDQPVTMIQRWAVRQPRPVARRIDPDTPLITGQRVIDSFFPVALGGAATIPGGFGTGKTVTEQSLARHAQVDVVIYVACGERGNELTELLEEFPKLVDPKTGGPLMDRTVLVANTSNMPVAAREASVYTGITIAEYFRDQGLHVALLADSTSRWGEALREVSGRLEEMPGEEGYPAYLPSRLADFYERAGSVEVLGSRALHGSVTIVGAVSPPGGDFSEPVTQQSLRLAGTFWALDTSLARRRHFPAIHWGRSYSLYALDRWFADHQGPAFVDDRSWALAVLQKEEELQRTVQLLGTDVLAPSERLVLTLGRVLREDFLQQSAFDEVDGFCALDKQAAMLGLVRAVHRAAEAALDRGVPAERIDTLPALGEVARMREWPTDEARTRAEALAADVRRALEAL